MANIRIMTPQELHEREHQPKRRAGRQRSVERTRAIEAYKAVLQDVQPGFGADVILKEAEDKRKVRQNLKAAAQDLNPVKDKSHIHFRVITPEEAATKPKRGGRPRKTSG